MSYACAWSRAHPVRLATMTGVYRPPLHICVGGDAATLLVVFILVNIQHHNVCMRLNDWRGGLRASHLCEVILTG